MKINKCKQPIFIYPITIRDHTGEVRAPGAGGQPGHCPGQAGLDSAHCPRDGGPQPRRPRDGHRPRDLQPQTRPVPEHLQEVANGQN